MLFLVLAAAALFLFSRNSAKVTFPEVNTPTPAPIDTAGINDSIDQALAVDIETGQQKTVTISGVAGAGATTAGSILLPAAQIGWAGPIGAAVAGAIILIAVLRSTAHLVANQVVDNYEKPFGARLGEIVDAKDRGVREGLATATDLKRVHNAIEVLWQQYQAAMGTLRVKGGDFAKVAQQSLDNLNSAAGMGGQFPEGFINRILSDIRTQIQMVGG